MPAWIAIAISSLSLIVSTLSFALAAYPRFIEWWRWRSHQKKLLKHWTAPRVDAPSICNVSFVEFAYLALKSNLPQYQLTFFVTSHVVLARDPIRLHGVEVPAGFHSYEILKRESGVRIFAYQGRKLVEALLHVDANFEGASMQDEFRVVASDGRHRKRRDR